MNTGYICISNIGSVTGIGGNNTGTYSSTDLFSMYSNGTTIYFYKNGVPIATNPYLPQFTPVKMSFQSANDLLYPIDITNIIFYPTGKLGPSGPSGPTGAASTISGPSGPSGVSGVSGPSGPSGVSGVSGPSGVSGVSGPSGPSGAVGPVATSISTSSVTGTSLTSGTSPAISTSTYGTYYYITHSGFNALTLPTTTAGSTVGSYWVLRNNTSTYLSITVTNNANLSNPLVIPPSNSTTIVVTTASSSPAYVLF